MMIEMCKATKEIYGYHNGLAYAYNSDLWSPCIHRPRGVMVPLDRKAYPGLYVSFDAKFDGGSRCTAIRMECGRQDPVAIKGNFLYKHASGDLPDFQAISVINR